MKLHLHVFRGGLYRSDDIRELSHSGGLNDDPIRFEFLRYLPERALKIPDQRTADAALIHLPDLNPGILEEAAVDADLSKLIFDEHDLLPLQRFRQKLPDKARLSGPQEAGDNIYFCHDTS